MKNYCTVVNCIIHGVDFLGSIYYTQAWELGKINH